MNRFVQDRQKVASPQPGQQRPSSRAEMGARAKVPVSGRGLTRQSVPPQPTGQNDHFGINSGQATTLQQHRQADEVYNARHDGDRYDTDAGSIDTSTLHGSVIQVPNGPQVAGQEGERSVTDESDSEDEERSDDETEQEFIGNENQEMDPRQFGNTGDFLVGGLGGGGNSYPSTTSGPPEDFNNWDTEAKQNMVRDAQQPEVQSNQNTWTHKPQHQASYQPRPSYSIAQPVTSKPNVFEQGKAIRQNNSTEAALRGNGSHQNASTRPNNQVPSLIQGIRGPKPLNAGIIRQNAPPPANNLPERGLRTVQGQIAPSGQTMTVTPQQTRTSQTVEGSPVEPESKPSPVEDYDLPVLYQMSYKNLNDESFDHPPRGSPQILSDEMNRKPLGDRLSCVFEKHGPAAQAKFFESLPLEEWEEAGSWFTGLFGTILQRTTEARQTKRKLAREFEAEIEKRYRHVEKRQQHMEDALSAMQRQGENLVPRSPRPSKEPRKT